MKTVVKIIFLAALTVLLSMAAMAGSPDVKTKVGHGKDKGLFVFKADRKLVGAKVEVLQSNGSMIAEQILQRRKLVIDFNDMKNGSYTIRVVKGTQTKEFSYTKRQ
jgi:hypothetical protein